VLVGRTDELRRLDDRVDDLVEGSGGALLVLGEPGIGVTSVLDALARRAAPRVRVLRLSVYAGADPGAIRHDLARAAGAEDGSTDAVVDALHDACSDGPVLLVVDDAHRLTDAAQRLLAEVVARSPGLLAVLGVQQRIDGVPAALADWDRLPLGRLDDEAALAVARAGIGRDAAALPALVARLHGNPCALRDVPSRLAAPVLDGHAPLPAALPVPAPLVEAWAEVLPAPDDPVEPLLLRLAVCTSARPGVGPRGLGPDERALLAGSPLVRWSLGDPTWASPWVPAVLVARSEDVEVRGAHAALAAAASDGGAAPSVVVHHLLASSDGLDDDIADALEVQARRADALGLPDVGATTWAAAALRTRDEGRRVQRALAGARGITATGPGMDAVPDLLVALEHADLAPDDAAVRERLRALRRLALDPDGRVEAMLAAVEQARRSDPGRVPDQLWELSVLASQHGDVATGVAAAEEYCALERAGAPGTSLPWTGTALLSAALFQAGRVEEAETLRRAACEAAASLDPATVDMEDLFTAVALDDLLLDTSASASQRLLRLVERLDGEAYPVACLYGIQGWRARARGDLVTARRMLRQGLDVAVPFAAVDVACGLGALGAELSAISGDGELDRTAPELRALLEGAGDRRRLSTLDRALGLQALVDGRLDEAVVHLSAAADAPMLGRGLRDGVLMARVDLVEVLVRADDHDGALRRAGTVLDVLDRMDDPLALALAARVRGLVAVDDDEAVRLLQEALMAHGEALDLFERARTHLLRGERLRRARHRGDARLDLLEAARRFEHLGAVPWLARAQAELRASGGPAPSAYAGPAGGPAHPERSVDLRAAAERYGLTAQELAVATAVAQGASNREVAEQLFLSPRTVEYHLGNVYRKLGVHGRGALGGRLLAPDPVPVRAR
jgi:DNA-binding CsgD family transcriptional regulator